MLSSISHMRRTKVTIPLSRIDRSFSRGSGNGGQNLHASHSRCLLKFNINTADWLDLKIKDAFLRQFGDAVTSRGMVVIVREDTRSPSDNEKLAIKQLRTMLDKAEEISLIERESRNFETEQARIMSTKSRAQIERYRYRTIEEKKLKSMVKQNRNSGWD